MPKVRELRGLIYAKYDTESCMAASIGWPKQRLSKITNGVKEPTLEELDSIAKGLGISLDEVAHIFLRLKSPNRQQNPEPPTNRTA